MRTTARWAVRASALSVTWILAGLAGVGGFTAVSDAWACAPLPNSAHCYGIATWSGSPVGGRGGKADLLISCIGAGSDPTDNFTTFEIWVGTNGKTDGSNWIEEGFAYGNPQGASRFWYWAERRPGYAYVEFDQPGTPALNTTYNASIRWYSNSPLDNWKIDENGSVIGTSEPNPLDTQYLSTGSETTADAGKVDGESSGLYWRDSSGNWILGWSYSGYGHASVSSDPPQNASWVTTYRDMVDTANVNNC